MSKRSFDQIDGPNPTQPLKIGKTEQENSDYQIDSLFCEDVWSRIVEFCNTREWLQLSYTCKGINQFKFNRSLMSNKQRTLKRHLFKEYIAHWFRMGRGTLFNVDLNRSAHVTDGHFQFLEGIHTLRMNYCENITDNAISYIVGVKQLEIVYCNRLTDSAFAHLEGIHSLDMSLCSQSTITDKAFSHLLGIKVLWMNGCNQSQITDKAFSYLSGIKTLGMRSCKQDTITNKAFVYLSGINKLDVSHCQRFIAPKILPQLKGATIIRDQSCLSL